MAMAAGDGQTSASLQDAHAIHAKLFVDEMYPTAAACGECHPKHFAEWSTSPHAYAQISPVFNAMQAATNILTNGTNADFCIRCHTPVGIALGEPILTENKNRAQASVEGITCIVCHRVNGDAGKISGRFKLQKGDIHAPVNSPSDGAEFQRVLDENGKADGFFQDLALKPSGGEFPVHAEIREEFFLTESSMCGTCHDVTFPSGFRLEEAFSEYKSSPAAKNGVSCQDCHMSPTEGQVADYKEIQPVAILPDGKTTRPRPVTNHFFAGPDYSIVHPGIFPIMQGEKAKLATMGEWVDFDLAWGTPDFEDNLPANVDFKHAVWRGAKNRREAHHIIYGPNGQIDKLEIYRHKQLDVLRAGYQLGKVEVQKVSKSGIDFRINVRNGTDGHNIPTGFIAERTLFVEVTVEDANGKVVFRSGDLDPNGDVRDLHSIYVHNGALPLDDYLFSLQSKFIVRLFRGGEREQVLPINFSGGPLPFNRPAETPNIGTGRPIPNRIHRVGLPPKGDRWANYHIDGDQLTGAGPYTAKVRLIAGMVPINLIEEIKIAGFDYGMNPRQVGDRVVAGRPLLSTGEFRLDAKGPVDVQWQFPPPGEIEWWQKPESDTRISAAGAHAAEAGQ